MTGIRLSPGWARSVYWNVHPSEPRALGKGEVIRSAIRLYLHLFSLKPKDRLRMLRLINEVIAPSRKAASELMEEVHAEEEGLYLNPSVLAKLFKSEGGSDR